ncbi:MAG: stage III sporulation protein AD [Clostridia bacterium]|nr:stage III sporulation protein AD [Clostridia bacterium]
MDILRVVAFAFLALAFLTVLRPQRPELGMLLSLAAGVTLFLALLEPIGQVVEMLRSLAARANVGLYLLGTVLKVLGVAYVAEFAAQVARDAQEGALAAKIELAGKCFILLLAVPVVTAIVDLVVRLLGA